MSQKIAFFDLDGTFFRWQLYHELVFELKNQGFFDSQTAERLDSSLMEWQAKRRSWREYEVEVISALEPLLSTLETARFDTAVQAVMAHSGHKIYSYTKQLFDNLKEAGYFTLAISGSQQEITEIFAEKYGFNACIGALYERKDGYFTGNTTRRIPGRKHEVINDFLSSHPHITLKGSVAIGDSEGDISMLEMAERPIAFNPSSGLLDEARKRGWEIVIERKSVAYSLRKGNDGQYLLAETDSF